MVFIVTLMRKNSKLLNTYIVCFALLGIPAVITLLLLLLAKHCYPDPEHFEKSDETAAGPFRMKKGFIFYIIAISLFAAGLAVSTLPSAPFAFFIFSVSSQTGLIIGIVLWGIGMGAQESILKSAVTLIVSKENRSTGFGIFQTSFGVCWFLGSALMGILYTGCRTGMVVFSLFAQLLAVPFFFMADRK